MVTRDGIETEVKFRIGNAEEIEDRLRKLHAKLVRTGLERNIRYDTTDRKLARSKELLRLRSYAGEADITHKRRAQAAVRGFKTREETIVAIDSFESGRLLLERLGYEKSWIYEKKRQIWELGTVEVLIDELPLIGNFLEIEGEPEEIRKAAERLGLDMRKALTTSYADEYEEFIKKNRLPREDLVFAEGER